MTNTSKVVALLADGKPRTAAEVAKAVRISEVSAQRALESIRKTGDCMARRQEILYTITPVGLSRVDRKKAIAEARGEELAERAAAATSKAKARAAVHAARTGAVPNSVFAWGQGSAA